jgi:hypothetical protein
LTRPVVPSGHGSHPALRAPLMYDLGALAVSVAAFALLFVLLWALGRV